MAIDFPSTVGQPTNGTFTYTVAGITYSWNGESWSAAGSGATATDRTVFSVTNAAASGGGSLAYNNTNGVFTFTPPSLSSYLTTESDTLNTVTSRGATTSNALTTGGLTVGDNQTINLGTDNDLQIVHTGSNSVIKHTNATSLYGLILSADTFVEIQKTTGSEKLARFNPDGGAELYFNNSRKLETTNAGVTITGALTSGGVTYPTDNGTNGYVLTTNGSGTASWVAANGLSARTTAAATATNVASAGSANISITTPKTYALLKIATSHACWVTLYTDSTSRTNDASRAETTDPAPGSGVLAEIITTGATTQALTPGVICFNNDGTPVGTTYVKVTNKSGSTASITVTLYYVQIEA